MSCRACVSRSVAERLRRSIKGRGMVKVGAIACIGCPSTMTKVVRKVSWRRTISLKVCSKAVKLSEPVRRSAVDTL